MKYKNILLSAAGVIFYAFGQLQYVPLLLLSVAINYAAGLILGGSSEKRKIVLGIAVALNLLMLCIFKYTDFIIENINTALGTQLAPIGITLPIGISFFTFQGISYVIDVYRSPEKKSKSFVNVLLYISFFPRLLAGPIVEYSSCIDELTSRKCTAGLTASGIRRFIKGMAKKLLISDVLGHIADTVFNECLKNGQTDFRLMWLGGICYMLQIYYDFSGYSDMAIGLGGIFGFHFPENFNFPYSASSIKEFWRKWHISLSTWFKDYLYIPLGGNRRGKRRAMLNRMTVFLCTGIWHGANWTFILWGLCHGLLSSLEDMNILPFARRNKTLPQLIIGKVYTLISVMLLFVIFRADSVSEAFMMIGNMFTGGMNAEGTYLISKLLTPSAVFALAAGILLCGSFVPWLKERYELKGSIGAANATALENAAGIVLFLLCILSLSKGGFSPFIYFQF